jgi:hypothetical protein
MISNTFLSSAIGICPGADAALPEGKVRIKKTLLNNSTTENTDYFKDLFLKHIVLQS